MFFSRITLHDDARGAGDFHQAFRSGYGLHQAVWQLFADHADRERDFLYHMQAASGPPVVYALSRRRPLASRLWQAETMAFAPKLNQGMRLGFFLRANPVRTREGKRHDVVMEEKHRLKTQGMPRQKWPLEAELVQEAGEKWLSARAEKAGFRLHAVRADGYRQHEFRKPAGRQPVRFSSIDFAGLLEVVDTEIFWQEALCRGLGPAKGFGCGLLLVRRA
ncbi:MAG: type I-E CRISPR-associated protein Cas6/Cse3/CasE [Thermodesulfobacteriota bacterium]